MAAGETIEGKVGTSGKYFKDRVGERIEGLVEKDSKEVDATVLDNNVDNKVEEGADEDALGQVNPAKVVSVTVKADKHVTHQT
jgi:hypothetical protein